MFCGVAVNTISRVQSLDHLFYLAFRSGSFNIELQTSPVARNQSARVSFKLNISVRADDVHATLQNVSVQRCFQ